MCIPNRYRIYIYARTAKGRGESYFIEVKTKAPGKPAMPNFSITGVGRDHVNVSWFVNAYADTGRAKCLFKGLFFLSPCHL